jgi:hypothetical protein
VFNAIQRRMVGHGALMLLVAMLAGIGLLVSVLGGVEILPGWILPLETPGNPAGWVRTHVGGILNALLVMVVALLLPGLGFLEQGARRMAQFIVFTGWANTLFYWAAMWAPNRALTFGDNRLGSANWISMIGLTPALVAVLVSIVAVAAIVRQAWRRE